MNELLLAPLSLLGGFLLALAAIPLCVGLFRLFLSKQGYLPHIFYISTLLGAVLIVNLGRNLFIYSEVGDLELPPPSSAMWIVWLARINSALFVSDACLRIASRIMQPKSNPDTPRLLITAFSFLMLTTVIAPAFLSAHPSFNHEHFYVLITGSAALLFRPGEEAIAIRAVRNTFYLLLLFSASFLLWKPELVLASNYVDGLIPGLTYRYVALTGHANILGEVSVIYILCLWTQPYKNRILNYTAWIMGYACLFFAQSKTSWIAFMVCMSCMAYFKHGASIKYYIFNFRNPALLSAFIATVMFSATLIVGIIMFSEIGYKINVFLSTSAGEGLMTMTGRNEIWAVAVNEWRKSPLFGYGLTLWDMAHRAKIGMAVAVSAHSQFYQTLASAGMFGVAGLIIYVLTLFGFVLKTAKSSEGLTLALFMIIFIRSFSEVSLAVTGHLGPDGLLHILLLMIVSAQYKSVSKPKKSPVPLTPQLNFTLMKEGVR